MNGRVYSLCRGNVNTILVSTKVILTQGYDAAFKAKVALEAALVLL